MKYTKSFYESLRIDQTVFFITFRGVGKSRIKEISHTISKSKIIEESFHISLEDNITLGYHDFICLSKEDLLDEVFYNAFCAKKIGEME